MHERPDRDPPPSKAPPVAVFTCDANGVIQSWEPGEPSFLALGAGVGRTIDELFGACAMTERIRATLAGRSESGTFELDGVVYRTHHHPLGSPGGPLAVTLALD